MNLDKIEALDLRSRPPVITTSRTLKLSSEQVEAALFNYIKEQYNIPREDGRIYISETTHNAQIYWTNEQILPL